MALNLHGRNFLKELDFTPDELRYLIALAAGLKAAKAGGYEKPALVGRNIALIFEKTSTRTRCAFEVAAHDQGAHVTYLDPSGSQLGKKESIKDTARVLGVGRSLTPKASPARGVVGDHQADASVGLSRVRATNLAGRNRSRGRTADHRQD